MELKSIRREEWNSKLGFILASVGSAVGLGNLWGFAYSSSEGGGAAFVILYIFVVLVVCFPIFVAEFALGRTTKVSAYLAPIKAAGGNWAPLGWLFILIPIAIASYYAVVMSWTGEVFILSLFDSLPKNAYESDKFFESISQGNHVFIGQLFSLGLGSYIVSGGIKKGIEKLNLICMPILFVILFMLVIWASFLGKAGEGYSNLFLNFDIKQLTNPTTIRLAFSQAFFSLSLGIGIMVTYASYLDKKSNLPKQAVQISFLDTIVGLMAGLITFPIIYTFNLSSSIEESTIGTLFTTIPTGLGEYGLLGRLMAVLFFGLAYLAAITSMVSLLEIPVSTLIDKFNIKRKYASIYSFILIFIIGIPSVKSISFLDNLDAVAKTLLIGGGFLVAFLMGWVLPRSLEKELENSGSSLKTKYYLKFMLKFITPVLVAWGFIISFYDLLIKFSS